MAPSAGMIRPLTKKGPPATGGPFTLRVFGLSVPRRAGRQHAAELRAAAALSGAFLLATRFAKRGIAKTKLGAQPAGMLEIVRPGEIGDGRGAVRFVGRHDQTELTRLESRTVKHPLAARIEAGGIADHRLFPLIM